MTGLLAVDFDDLVECTRTLLLDGELRQELGVKAILRARDYHWESTAQIVDATLGAALRSGRCRRT